MTAFLKIDACKTCQRALPWEWVPAVLANGKTLAGTGVWRTQLTRGLCPACLAALEALRQKEQNDLALRAKLIELLGGERAYREFTLERYEVAPGNQLAHERINHFNPCMDNLYLWGPCGVGKTHLVWAAARHCFEETLSVTILPAYQLSRKIRMKDPAQEQGAIDDLADSEVLVLDDLGTGPDTPFSRQILQEILDRRAFNDSGGLLVTSKYSLDELAAKLADDTIPSRLAGMCHVVEIKGSDWRLMGRLEIIR